MAFGFSVPNPSTIITKLQDCTGDPEPCKAQATSYALNPPAPLKPLKPRNSQILLQSEYDGVQGLGVWGCNKPYEFPPVRGQSLHL